MLSVKSVSCPVVSSTLCDPMDCSLSGSPIHGILQARILEWVTIPFSRGSSPSRDHRFFTICATREALFSSRAPPDF